MWMKRLLTVNKLQHDRTLFPRFFAGCVEFGIISRQQAKIVVMKNIEYMIDEQLWEDVPNLWENWAAVVGVGTRESFVSVKNIQEEYLLNFDEDVEEDCNYNSNDQVEEDNQQQNQNQNQNQNQHKEFKMNPNTGLHTTSTLLLHPAWHNHLLAKQVLTKHNL